MAVGNTAIWRARPSGVNTNGGGYDSGIAGAATDYSQQNVAQATGTNGSGAATTTFTDATAAAFTAAMIGNAINIAGQGFYFVTAFTDASHVVVDRALGTFSGASWRLGGGWRDWWTNSQSTGPLVPGNRVRILGSGTPNPAAYVADYTFAGVGTAVTLVSGDSTNGMIVFENDPATPGYKAPPDTTGGMPVTSIDGAFIINGTNQSFAGLYFFASAANGTARLWNTTQPSTIFGCVLDVLSFANIFSGISDTSMIAGNEIFSSTSNSGAPAQGAIIAGGFSLVLNNNIHDISVVNAAIWVTGNGINTVEGNIVAKCPGGGAGILVEDNRNKIVGNTIDGNGGHGISVDTQANLAQLIILNNIISNHTVAGKAGLNISAGTAAQNSRVAEFVDYNIYYNNTTNYSGINAGPHDTALGVSPYVNSATENYALA